MQLIAKYYSFSPQEFRLVVHFCSTAPLLHGADTSGTNLDSEDGGRANFIRSWKYELSHPAYFPTDVAMAEELHFLVRLHRVHQDTTERRVFARRCAIFLHFKELTITKTRYSTARAEHESVIREDVDHQR